MDVFKKYLRRTLRALFSLRELSESEESPMMGELGDVVVVTDMEGRKVRRRGKREGKNDSNENLRKQRC